MSAAKYERRDGFQLPVDPQTVGETLEEIRIRENGRLTPEVVVDSSREDEAPLHPCFEWRDDVAAERFRVEQARYVVRSVVIVNPAEGTPTPTVRAFVSVRQAPDEARTYTSVTEALMTPGQREQVIENARRELVTWSKRYREYQEVVEALGGVFEAIDVAVEG